MVDPVRHVRVVGLGMGPDHLTREAEAVLATADAVVAFRKGTRDPLLEVRRAVCHRFGLPLVEVDDPRRDRDDPADYPAAVRQWHRQRVAALLDALHHPPLGQDPATVAFLVWGDPSWYDSTVRLLQAAATDRALTWDVVPGISAPQVLAARHRVVLHPVGHPVHVTTARRLPEAVAGGQRNVVVVLGDDRPLAAPDDWWLWWGANLGAAGERLVAGPLGAVRGDVAAARARARAEAGWVMDTALLRAPELC